MIRVLNRHHHGVPEGAIYVGRPSKWGNPFIAGRDGTRKEVIAKYRVWLLADETLIADLHELRGKDLVCWCSPQACHAEVLAELANLPEKSLTDS